MSSRSRFQTGDHALVRQMNLSVILHHLLERAPVSRATLAEMTKLNKATVSSLVRELIEYQIVREIGIESAGTGRPGVLLELNPGAGCIVSAEIGVDFISVILTNFAVEMKWQHREQTHPGMGQPAIMSRALSLMGEAIEAGREAGSVFGLALGVPGLVDQANGTLLFAPNLGWRDVPLGSILRDAFNIPVFVNNEANMAALGEHYFGAAQEHEEVLYISAGVGLGGGIVRNGRLVGGRMGFAGEFGHMTMDPNGELCNCGNRGCWETLVSQSALFRHVRRAVGGDGQSSILSEMVNGDPEQLSVPIVVEAARGGDAIARRALDEVGRYLGIGIASLVNALNPELVVFGGILSVAGEFLLPIVEEELRRRTLYWPGHAVEVVLARHGLDACVLGGVATVYQAVLTQPTY
ncbi:MAG TPA: ROK family transcriptional regulator, partial [Ardenticatenaceae bacterium]